MILRYFGNEASVHSISLCPMSYSVLLVIRKNILHFNTIYSMYKDDREIRWKKVLGHCIVQAVTVT